MKVGMTYKAVKRGGSFEIAEGEIVTIPTSTLIIEVLPKPTFVWVNDGSGEKREPLPEHLTRENWFAVKNLLRGHNHWLNIDGYVISEVEP